MRLMNTPDFGLEVLVVGGLRTNCYILWRQGSGTAVVIDPGGSVDKILEFISVENLNVKFIINTHGHDDHIGGNRDLRLSLIHISVMEYFEIFMNRMIMCRKAAASLDCKFSLQINGAVLL